MPTRIDIHPDYDDSRIIVRQILRLGNAIKRDISRIIKYQSWECWEKTNELIVSCKARILQRLKEVAKIRKSKKVKNEEQWNRILRDTISQVYKHTDSPEVIQNVQSLLGIDQIDTSETDINFLQAYMKIIARIPENQIILPFKP